jgi:hypothetical protein
MLNDTFMNKVIEAALTLLAIVFILSVIVCVLAAAIAVFLDLVDRFNTGIHYVKKLSNPNSESNETPRETFYLFSRRVPKRRCKKCVRFRGYCPLLDLDPCSFVKKPKEKK